MERDHTEKQVFDSRDALMRERELAERWQTSVRTLQRWRADRLGPAYILIGGTVRYRFSDVLSYENEHRRRGHSDG